ncbi:MAG: bifunctional tRNA (5-methylaminomethyl-2-thiouridine)(34)-methyltransferase MnmD/FAD-dependent 5-carboxymethylaminomethyl-2-thiouridine(34) oxidoreductase MnmC [Burkholderiales bacterium]|jgi:tRNA 5-methylaminomethyl-2-thiouridine biosynthesis bifunctional protein|nr:bifunctional tRNA (5-methylaminomethyl-2-thiouridine)(34)-methyltransferase MnmD/FAD-dependent 5-carboxymethylaminomethyl-2-thiouridine(34) oxidoreductase MnmC [Burkholderiales bacterium]
MSLQIDWNDGQPVSRLYGDVFFSRDSGIAEKRHVFLEGNRLAARFAALPPDGRFVIGETGFGTGLNLLAAWQLWDATAPPGARLHYFSVEKHPLSRDDLITALALWPELATRGGPLVRQWNESAEGWHRFRLADGRVQLTLGIGDAAERLAEADVAAHAWFLDGFAPAKNPRMWTGEVLREVARLSRTGSTFSTYTAAGDVKRGLEAVGFLAEKAVGYGRKRDMLRGEFQGRTDEPSSRPWFARPPAHSGERKAVVVGAGLAGCAAADALAARGWHVTVLDRNGVVASEASGNPQGILYARLSGADTPVRRVVLAGLQHALRRVAQVLPESDDTWRRTGVLQLAFDADEQARQEALLAASFPRTLFHGVTRAEAQSIAGVELPSGGVFFPGAGWVHPPALCRALVDRPGIEVRRGDVAAIDRADGLWRIHDTAGEATLLAPVVVVATAHESRALATTRHLPLRTISGQVTALAATPRSAKLATVLSGEGYAAPARHGAHTIGATHRMREASTDVRVDDHATNLAMLARLAPALFDAAGGPRLDPAALAGRAGVRCTSPDTLPIVGPVADNAALDRVYAPLARDATLDLREPAPWLPGLFVTSAHGSRGLVTSLLAAEILAALIEGEPYPVAAPLVATLYPTRFAVRDLARRQQRRDR